MHATLLSHDNVTLEMMDVAFNILEFNINETNYITYLLRTTGNNNNINNINKVLSRHYKL